jgi:hypothetical protein
VILRKKHEGCERTFDAIIGHLDFLFLKVLVLESFLVKLRLLFRTPFEHTRTSLIVIEKHEFNNKLKQLNEYSNVRIRREMFT